MLKFFNDNKKYFEKNMERKKMNYINFFCELFIFNFFYKGCLKIPIKCIKS